VNIEHTADEPPLAPQARDMQACCGRLLMRAQRTNLAGRSQAPERGHEHEHASRDFMWLDAWAYGKGGAANARIASSRQPYDT